MQKIKKILTNVLCLFLFIMISLKINAETIGYVFSTHGEVYKIDFDSLKILQETNIHHMINNKNLTYNKNLKKSFIIGSDWDLFSFDMTNFKIEKTISPPISYRFYGDIFLNSQKNVIYLNAENEKKEDRLLIYTLNGNDYPYSEIVDEFFLYYQFTSDGEYLYRISKVDENRKFKIEKKDTKNLGLIKTYNSPELFNIDILRNFILSPDNKRLYINCKLISMDNCHELVIDVESGTLIKDLVIDVFPIILSNDNKYLYTLKCNLSPDGRDVIFVKVNTIDFSTEEILLGDYFCSVLALSPDESIFVMGGGNGYEEGEITVFNLKDKKIKGQIKIEFGVAAIYFK